MQTCFSMFCTRTPLCLQHIAHIFLVSQILLKVIYYEVTGWCISQENQFGDGTGGGTINYIIQLKSQSFEQIIFIVSIVCSSFEKQFLFVSLVVKCLWLDALIYTGKSIFQYACKTSKKILLPGQTMVSIQARSSYQALTYFAQKVRPLTFVAFNIFIKNVQFRLSNCNRCDAWGGLKRAQIQIVVTHLEHR